MAQNIYDDPSFFAAYACLPRSRQGLDAAPEWAALRAMLPPLAGLRVLDLGCGFGWFARWAAQSQAASVQAIDLSEKMIAHARDATSPFGNVTVERADLETLRLPAQAFDLVYSALVLHYVEHLAALLATLHQTLSPGGSFVFSVEHPIFTAPSHPRWEPRPGAQHLWGLDQYLVEGPRVTDWLAPGVVKQHRTIASYVRLLHAPGFRIVALEEWGPSAAQIALHPEWASEVHRPPFLLIAARREPAAR